MMFDEVSFKSAYKAAYDNITLDKRCVEGIADRVAQQSTKTKGLKQVTRIVRPVAVTFAALCVTLIMFIPTMAKSYPAVYNIVAKYAPALIDFIVPTELKSTDSGIIMQLEAVNVDEKTAEIIVSFTDDTGNDFINGKMDISESYKVESYGAVSNIGGCSFLTYDEAEDKAYFKISATTFSEFNHARVNFNVYRLMSEEISENRIVELDGIIMNPVTKSVTLNGRGGDMSREELAKLFQAGADGSSRVGVKVLDIKNIDASMADSIEVVGVAYANGVLRVQVCRGELDKNDRHAQLFFKSGDGKTQVEDCCVYWKETIDGVEMDFSEHWFLISEEQLEYARMYGVFNETGECVEGNWEVTVEID